MEYKDGLNFIYFNTKGTKGGNSSIKKLLNYIQDSKLNNVTDDATRKIHECVNKVKVLPEVRNEYMTLEDLFREERLEGRIEGREEGRAEGAL